MSCSSGSNRFTSPSPPRGGLNPRTGSPLQSFRTPKGRLRGNGVSGRPVEKPWKWNLGKYIYRNRLSCQTSSCTSFESCLFSICLPKKTEGLWEVETPIKVTKLRHTICRTSWTFRRSQDFYLLTRRVRYVWNRRQEKNVCLIWENHRIHTDPETRTSTYDTHTGPTTRTTYTYECTIYVTNSRFLSGPPMTDMEVWLFPLVIKNFYKKCSIIKYKWPGK